MNNQNDAHLRLSSAAQQTILRDIHERASIEACGVLLGERDEQGNWHAEQAYPLRNTFASPVYFEFAPEELLEVELRYPNRIVGVYHSHPTGFPRASNTDKENMRRVNLEQDIPWAWLIVSGPFDATSPLMCLPVKQLIGYHHYSETGLRCISVQLT
jgi:proteasome lid subunit RPN8/RPN11